MSSKLSTAETINQINSLTPDRCIGCYSAILRARDLGHSAINGELSLQAAKAEFEISFVTCVKSLIDPDTGRVQCGNTLEQTNSVNPFPASERKIVTEKFPILNG